jgi:virginiamycin B lyase
MRTGYTLLRVASAGALFAIAACSGVSPGVTPGAPIGANARELSPSSATSATATDREKSRGQARISIQIPHKKRTGRRMHPDYISPSTESMTVVVAGEPKQTFNLTPASSGCSTDASGNLSCVETVYLPTGLQTITVTLYDQPNGKGDQLSTASTSATIQSGIPANIPITLNGVPATAEVLVGPTPAPNVSVPQGTPTSVPVAVSAFDAKGNLIMAPGAYSSPITLSDSDTSGATKLSTSSVGAPGADVTLSYSGAAVSADATIAATIGQTVQTSGTATVVVFSEYSPHLPPSTAAATAIVTGPDRALWFTGLLADAVGRMTTGGSVTTYSTPAGANEITSGPDGALWFTGCFNGTIGRITTTGTVTEYSVPSPSSNSAPQGITSGPDGALWFTDCGTGSIGRITTGGAVAEYSVPLSSSSSRSSPQNITSGPDGALWFTDCGTKSIGRVTTGGQISEFTLPPPAVLGPGAGITKGSDGALWFTGSSNMIAIVGRITTGGTITIYPTGLGGGFTGEAITSGPDGALWLAAINGSQTDTDAAGSIDRITTTGTVTAYTPPFVTLFPGMLGITTGPDGALWFTDDCTIGRMPVPASATSALHRKAVRT